MKPDRFKQHLLSRLRETLPGTVAQTRMAPVLSGNENWKAPEIILDVPESAVLLLLSPISEDEVGLTLTLRSGNLPTHAGQLSLPGGRIESAESVVEAALRETHEEVGISRELPEVMGRMSPLYVHHSGNLIHPVVAWIDDLPAFKLNQAEVSEAFVVSISHLLDEAYIRRESWNLRGQDMIVPYWTVHRVPLWGATAMILSEFCVLLNDGD